MSDQHRARPRRVRAVVPRRPDAPRRGPAAGSPVRPRRCPPRRSQRRRGRPAAASGRAAARPPVPAAGPLPAGDVPLLTHDETGATSVARAHGVALAERPPLAGPAGRAGRRRPRSRPARRSPLRRRLRLALYSLLGAGRARAGAGLRDRLDGLRRCPTPTRRRSPRWPRSPSPTARTAGRGPPGERQPGQGHPGQGARARPAGRAGRRGQHLLHQPRLRHLGHRAGHLQPAHRRRRRRLDDHPAVREGGHRRARPHAVAQVQGGRARGQDLQGAARRTRSWRTT